MPDHDAATELEDRIRADLQATVDSGPDPSDRHLVIDARIESRQHHFTTRRRVIAGATAATVAVGAGLAWRSVALRDPAPDQRLDAGPRSTGARREASWHHIEAAPLSGRIAPAIVWAGDQLIVWSGNRFPGDLSLNPADGATWRPGADWRPIADGPAGMVPGGFAVWDGAEMFVGPTEADSAAPWNVGRSEEDARYGIAAYDPIADRWRYLAPIVPDETRQLGPSRQAVLAGGQLLVAVELARPGTAGHSVDVVAYDPTTGESQLVDPGPFAASPYPDASGTVSLTTVGDSVVATPNFDLRPWILDTVAGTWTRLPAPETQSLHLLSATGLGDQAGFFENDSDQLWILDPSTASWKRATSNAGHRARWGFEPAWSGQEMFIPGAAYDPDLDRWRNVEPPPRRKNRQRHLTSTWADGLLLFGGEEYTCPDDVTCDRDRTDPDSLDGWLLAP